MHLLGFPGGSDGKEHACNAGDPGSIPGSGRSAGLGNSNPLQYSCVGNPMHRGAWRAQSMGLQNRTYQHTQAQAALLQSLKICWHLGGNKQECERVFHLLFQLCVCVCESFSRVWFYVTPWTVACQASLSMGFSRQDYWSGLPFPSPGDLPNPGIEPRSCALQADSLPSEPPGKLLYVVLIS